MPSATKSDEKVSVIAQPKNPPATSPFRTPGPLARSLLVVLTLLLLLGGPRPTSDPHRACLAGGGHCTWEGSSMVAGSLASARRMVSGGSIRKLPPPKKGHVPIDGKYKTETSKKYYQNPKGARITKSSHFNFQYVLGHKIVFLCVAKGNPLPTITWFKDGVELYAHKYMQLHEWTRGHKLKSKMEIDPASQADAGIYECHANNKFAVDSRAFRTTYLAEFN